jgi:hypothetical protein
MGLFALKKPSKCTNATLKRVAFAVLRRSLAPPKHRADGGFSHRTYCRFTLPVHPFSGATCLAVSLARHLLFFELAGILSEQRGLSLAPIYKQSACRSGYPLF